MTAQNEDANFGEGISEPACGFQPVHSWKGTVHHHDIWRVLFDPRDGLLTIGRFADDIELQVSAQTRSYALTHVRIIIYK
jgi:hypothetical protein